MNQSKYSKLIATWFLIAFVAAVSFQVYCHRPSCASPYYYTDGIGGSYVEYHNISWDAANTYAPTIDGKIEVSDWHSALYMYECKMALKVARALGIPADGIKIQIAAYYLYIVVFISFASFLLYYTVKKNYFMALLFFPICWSTNTMIKWMPLGLDFFFFVHLFILCCAITFIPRIKKKHMKYIALFIVFIALFHAVNFRKNAILLIPFFVYTCLHVRHESQNNKTNLFLKWVLTTILFSVLCVKLVCWVLPVNQLHPEGPMLSSDLRISAVLRGEQEQFREEMRHLGTSEKRLNHPFMDSLTAAPYSELFGGKYHSNAYKTYINHCMNHPGSMIISRAIQIIEFYCGGMPHPIRRLVEHIYPALKTNSLAWNIRLNHPRSNCSVVCIYFAGLALVGWVLFQYRKNGNWTEPCDKPIAAICAVALIYAASFAIVTPCVGVRYIAPSLFIIWNACWIWLAFRLSHIAQEEMPSLEKQYANTK